MSEDLVNIEVNGVPVAARKGQMIIQATDAVDVYVPRFCYHDKLSVAANCRMCLVEVEKAPKPLPACATPVAEGMKIFTKSPKAMTTDVLPSVLARSTCARDVIALSWIDVHLKLAATPSKPTTAWRMCLLKSRIVHS